MEMRLYIRHSWASRTVPPLLVAAIFGGVWYSLASRPQTPAFTPEITANFPTNAPHGTVNASAQPAPQVSPTVQKHGSQLQFSVAAIPYKNVQRVEFYVEAQFVGTAYSQPYSVAISENNIAAGTHTVTAKIYTNDSSANSQPATFISQPAIVVPPPAVNTSQSAAGSSPIATPASPASLGTPTGLAVTASSDGTSATLEWITVSGATQYQVWRDSSQVATATGTGYSDTGVNPGQTYDYQIIAIGANASKSGPSATVAVTMPTPQDTGPVNAPSPAVSKSGSDDQTPGDTASGT